MTNKVCFVILHYGNNVTITKKAVLAIKQLDYKGQIDIVIVCNGLEYDISKQFTNEIDFIILEENKGFSVGNNIGYAHAKKKDDYDFIIIINNDVIVEQTYFLDKLYQLYNDEQFFVCGPDVYVPYKDFHSSPMKDHAYTESELNALISLKKKRQNELKKPFSISCAKLYILESLLNGENSKNTVIFRLWRIISKRNKNYTVKQENVVLQGSCLVFSRNFISINQKAFVPEVFLYFEEDYLHLRCLENKWKVIYSNEIQVMHYHRGSSNLRRISYKDYCERRLMIENEFLKSAEQYKEYINRETE